MPISRVHETISMYANGNGKINKVKVPYLEMKKHDINSIIQDVKRMRSVFTQAKSMKAVLDFLENNIVELNDGKFVRTDFTIPANARKGVTAEPFQPSGDRCTNIMQSVEFGLNEKTIIRTDRINCDNFTKFGVNADQRKTGDRCADVMQSVEFGLNEKTIVKEIRDHYTAIHPTQKPVRLLERLLALVSKPGYSVFDGFAGSMSCAEACYNTGRKFIGCEIDKEYFEAGKKRIENLPPRQTALFE